VSTSTPFDELERLQRLVERSLSYAHDVHQDLRPALREIAGHRLARHGIALDAQPEAAARLLGPALHDLVRADRPRPDDPFGPGLRAADLAAALDRLEAL
jgi:hypothetical protein